MDFQAFANSNILLHIVGGVAVLGLVYGLFVVIVRRTFGF